MTVIYLSVSGEVSCVCGFLVGLSAYTRSFHCDGGTSLPAFCGKHCSQL